MQVLCVTYAKLNIYKNQKTARRFLGGLLLLVKDYNL